MRTLLLRHTSGRFVTVTVAEAVALGKKQPGEWQIVGDDAERMPRHGETNPRGG